MPDRYALDILKKVCPTISIGIFSADMMNLQSELALLERAGIDLIHFDIMDGCFVPTLTAGPFLVKSITTDMFKDVHLLIRDPEDKFEEYVNAGADIITIHLETCKDLHRVLYELKKMESRSHPGRQIIRGVALNPGTPPEQIEPYINDIEMITILAIDPTVKNSGFTDSTFDKFTRIKKMISTRDKEIVVCIDGGIKRDNIASIAKMGADIVVSGSAIFRDHTPGENIKYMLETIKDQTN
jgi:ribulose-phosphate 3-epimerase